MLQTQANIIAAMGKTVDPAVLDKIAEDKKTQEEAQKQAEEFKTEAISNIRKHESFANSITFVQASIAIGAIAVLMKRKRYWFLSLGFGAVGLAFFALGAPDQIGPLPPPALRRGPFGGLLVHMETLLRIEGMSCDNCARTVQQALLAVPGVDRATVSLEEKRAVVGWAGGDGATDALLRARLRLGL